jgi:lantibiotic protection ABC superfamily ATP binding cassette transporter
MKLNISPFIGQHCETTATGTLLEQLGIKMSEPMLFGLGEGLGFIIWNMKTMDFPFIGGRIKTDLVTKNIAKNLGLKLIVKETTSANRAWSSVKELLDNNKAVGLKLDCYHLEYFSNPIHFAGHYVAIIGYDETYAYLIDTAQQGTSVKTSLASLEKARSEKGPMSSKNLYYTLDKTENIVTIKDAVINAIKNNSLAYLNPPIKNLTYKGIIKASDEIIKWFDTSKNIREEFNTSAMLMERAGTGGSIFRNLYRDFLKEAGEITQNETVYKTHDLFNQVASDWSNVIELFENIGQTQDKKYVLQASKLMKDISTKEKYAMEQLLTVTN